MKDLHLWDTLSRAQLRKECEAHRRYWNVLLRVFDGDGDDEDGVTEHSSVGTLLCIADAPPNQVEEMNFQDFFYAPQKGASHRYIQAKTSQGFMGAVVMLEGHLFLSIFFLLQNIYILN